MPVSYDRTRQPFTKTPFALRRKRLEKLNKIVLDSHDLALLSRDFEISSNDDGLFEKIANSSDSSNMNYTGKRVVLSSRAKFNSNAN